MSLSEALLPVNIFVDVMALDYEGPNEVWFGVSVLFECRKPGVGNVVIATRKDRARSLAGAHVAIGGNRWVAQPNNFDFPVMQWCRMRIEIEKFVPRSALAVRAKVWKEAECEPPEWMTEAVITDEDLNWNARGIALAAESLHGQKHNPRVVFDNLVVYQGNIKPQLWALMNKLSGDRLAILSVFDDPTVKELYALLDSAGPGSLNYSGLDETLFLEMLALRKMMKWEEARERANLLMEFFPASPLCRRMGGKDGRTEDQAAEDFAIALRQYQKPPNYERCRELFNAFVENYPENWRRQQAEFYRASSLYYMGKELEFLKESGRVVKEGIISAPYLVELLYLQTAVLVRQGKSSEARQLIADIERKYPNSPMEENLRQMSLESYLYPFNGLTPEKAAEVLPLFQERLERSLLINRWVEKNLNFGVTIYDKIGRTPDDKRNLFEDAMKKSSANMPAHLSVALAYAKFLRLSSGEKSTIELLENVLDRVSEPCKERDAAIDYLAQIYLENGDREKASRLAKRKFTQ